MSRRGPPHPPTGEAAARLLWTGILSIGKDQAAPPPLFIPGPYLIKQCFIFRVVAREGKLS